MGYKIKWDKSGERLYEAGVDHVVLYRQAADGSYPKGVAWNGITAVNESPEGAESNKQYADNIAYLNLVGAEEFKGSIEAFMYPDEFAECNGEKQIVKGLRAGQQNRVPFGLATRTVVGNDTEGQNHGFKLHLYYGLQASPSERNYETMNEDPEAVEMSWDVESTPIDPEITGFKPLSTLVIDSTDYESVEDKAKLDALMDKLYGSDAENGADGYLPLPKEVATTLGWTET